MNINKILIIYKNVIWYIHMWCMYIYIYKNNNWKWNEILLFWSNIVPKILTWIININMSCEKKIKFSNSQKNYV